MTPFTLRSLAPETGEGDDRAAVDNDYADDWSVCLDLLIVVRAALYPIKH